MEYQAPVNDPEYEAYKKMKADQAAEAEKQRQAAEVSAEQQGFIDSFNSYFDATTPHADRPTVLNGKTVGEGVHVLKLKDSDGRIHLAILLEDADTSSLLEA